jgi:hypothetical protein
MNVIYIIFVTSSDFVIQTYEIESIFLNHPVLYCLKDFLKYTKLCYII